MKKVLVAAAVFILAGLGPNQAQRQVMSEVSAAPQTPPTFSSPTESTRPSDQEPVFQEPSARVAHAQEIPPAEPIKISIPSIKLNSPVQSMGLDQYGRLDVPDGRTKNVGWYGQGTLPGNKGTAVFDAHVYAAFKNLHKVKIGDEIVVTDKQNNQHNFIVQEMNYYQLEKLSPEHLFNRKDAKRINLITCAGNQTGDERGYDQRLVVSAVLAE